MNNIKNFWGGLCRSVWHFSFLNILQNTRNHHHPTDIARFSPPYSMGSPLSSPAPSAADAASSEPPAAAFCSSICSSSSFEYPSSGETGCWKHVRGSEICRVGRRSSALVAAISLEEEEREAVADVEQSRSWSS